MSGTHGTCPGCGLTSFFAGLREGDPAVCPECKGMFDARLRTVAAAPAPAPASPGAPSTEPAPPPPRRRREIAIALGIGLLVLFAIVVVRDLSRDRGLRFEIEARAGQRLQTQGRTELRYERTGERGGVAFRQRVRIVDERDHLDTVIGVYENGFRLSRAMLRASRLSLGDQDLVLSETPSPFAARTLVIAHVNGNAVIVEGAPPGVPNGTAAFLAIAPPEEPMLPDDRWALAASDLPAILGLDTLRVADVKGDGEWRYEAVEPVEADTRARLVATVRATFHDVEHDVKVRVRGEVTVRYSLAERRFVTVDGELPVTVTAGGADTPGTLSVHVRVLRR